MKTEINVDHIVEKWSAEGFLDDIKNDQIRQNTAMVLESQEEWADENEIDIIRGNPMLRKALLKEATTSEPITATSGIEKHPTIVVPLVRRIFPELVGNYICGVQPMLGPTGYAYGLRYRFDNTAGTITAGDEAGYNNIDRTYTGTHSTSAGERLGEAYMGSPTGGTMREVSLNIEREAVEAETRKLKARYSLEAAQDIKVTQGIDLNQKMIEILNYEVKAEIDRELVNLVITAAQAGGQLTFSTASSGSGVCDDTNVVRSDGRWEQEKFRTLFTAIQRLSEEIARDTRRGAGNFILATSKVVTALQELKALASAPMDEAIVPKLGNSFVGNIGTFRLFRDLMASDGTTEYAVIGYSNPNDSADNGVIYCPYIPLMLMNSINPESFNPILGAMTRYATTNNILSRSGAAYYRYLCVDFTDTTLE